MKTIVRKKEELKDTWVLIDGTNQVLGRLASKIAIILRGKDLPTYSPHLPGENGVIVINADKIALTGRKKQDKLYRFHSGYPGGLKTINYETIIKKHPDFPLQKAVKGMLPKNRLARHLLTRLKIYVGETHPHTAQQPQKIEI